MGKRNPTLVDNLLRYWPIYGIGVTVCGAIVLWGGLPDRVAKAEQKNEAQDDSLVDLKGIASRLDGYIQGQQQTNQLLMQQQAPNVPTLPVKANTGTITFREQDRHGRWWCSEDQVRWTVCP